MWKRWQTGIKWHCCYLRWETWSVSYYWLGVNVWVHSFSPKGSNLPSRCCLAYISLFTILFKVIAYLKRASNQLLLEKVCCSRQLSLLNTLKKGLTDVLSQALCVSLLLSPSLLSQDSQHCRPCPNLIPTVPGTPGYGNQLSHSKASQ